MRRFVFAFTLLLVLFSFASCTTTSMADFYEPWFEDGVVPEECFLKEGSEPDVYYTKDFDSDIYFLQSNYYLILGEASYNGPAESELKEQVTALCKAKRATIGLYGYQYTDTRTGVYSSGRYINSYEIKRYDYNIYLFAPMPEFLMMEKARIGLSCRNLDSSDRLSTKRNVGAYVSVVYDSSPAFYANISRGDVIAEVNGTTIANVEQLDEILKNADASDTLLITLYRGGLPFTVNLSPMY
jgi:hypothetical protein